MIVWATEAVAVTLQVIRSTKAGMYIIMQIDVKRVFDALETRRYIR